MSEMRLPPSDAPMASGTGPARVNAAALDGQQCKYVLVVDNKNGRHIDSALVNVLDKEGKVIVQQFLVSRAAAKQLVLRELPLLKRGVVFASASVIQHQQYKSKLVFLFTSPRADLQGSFIFRVVAHGSFVDSELVPSPASVPAVLRGVGVPSSDGHGEEKGAHEGDVNGKRGHEGDATDTNGKRARTTAGAG